MMSGRPTAEHGATRPASSAGPSRPGHDATREVLVVTSAALFDGHAEVRIEHHGAVYRLKQTSLGKLILTK